jgi:DHA1 family bicyclomycin/chloramphenicol resistance-like MFS transporter
MPETTPPRFLDRKSPPHVLTLILMSGLSALAMNIFLPSLPGMGAHFGTTAAVMGLSVGIYLAMSAVIQLFAGPVADNIGRRPVILGSLLIFCLATLGCLWAPNVVVFMVFRMAQAFAVVGMVLSRAVVRDMVPMEQAGSRIAYVTMGMAVVPMLAPALGGALDLMFGWQANFWLLFGAGLLLIALAWADLGETNASRGLTMGQQFREYPELLRSPRFWGYCLSGTAAGGAFFAYLGGAPYVGSEVFGLSPALVGFYFGAPALGYFFGNWISGRFSVRVGINAMILWGTVISAAGLTVSLLLFLLGFKTALVFFGFMTFVGLGNGMVLPNATSGMLSVRPHLAGTASGLGGAIMIGGGAALSALAGALLTGGNGAYPLILIMLFTSILAVLSILYTIRRERQVTG